MQGEKQRLITANWAMQTHSHCRDRTSRHPSRRSARIVTDPSAARPPGAAEERGAPDVSTSPADSRNDSASNASPQPGPTPTTSTPDTDAPSRRVEFCASWISAFADCTCDPSTTCGIRPRRHG
jgi:hypothetical protein